MTEAPALTPYLTVADARAAVDFYRRAFGAVELGRQETPDRRKVIRVALSINGALVMLSDDFPELTGRPVSPQALGGSPVTMHLNVPDVDAFFARAVAEGATVTLPLADAFWGDRFGKLRDPFGHHWSVATPVRTVTREELEKSARERLPAHA
ncbi:MAG TPA: VOC family protein [Polyangiaceae bacterium]|nr:VOC family protein [Polyangiaceae bacterium]